MSTIDVYLVSYIAYLALLFLLSIWLRPQKTLSEILQLEWAGHAFGTISGNQSSLLAPLAISTVDKHVAILRHFKMKATKKKAFNICSESKWFSLVSWGCQNLIDASYFASRFIFLFWAFLTFLSFFLFLCSSSSGSSSIGIAAASIKIKNEKCFKIEKEKDERRKRNKVRGRVSKSKKREKTKEKMKMNEKCEIRLKVEGKGRRRWEINSKVEDCTMKR